MRRHPHGRLALITVVGLWLIGCGAPPDLIALNGESQTAFRQAEKLFTEGKAPEVVRLLLPVRLLHPDDDRVQGLIDKLPLDQVHALLHDSLLGFNKGKRAPIDASVTSRILLYLPDRLLDLLDVFGVEVNFGPQAGAGFWLTRAMQAKAFFGSTAGLGVYQKRNIGGRTEASAELVIGPGGGSALAGGRGGTGGVDGISTALPLHLPSEELYQVYRDYWGIGAKVGAGIVGVEFEFHILELADFLGGWFLADFLNDDLATTRRLRFNRNQQETYEKLIRMIGELSPEGMQEYWSKYPHVFPEGREN